MDNLLCILLITIACYKWELKSITMQYPLVFDCSPIDFNKHKKYGADKN